MQNSPSDLVNFIYTSTSVGGVGWGWRTPKTDIVLKLREIAANISKCPKGQLKAILLELEGYATTAKVLGALNKEDLEYILNYTSELMD